METGIFARFGTRLSIAGAVASLFIIIWAINYFDITTSNNEYQKLENVGSYYSGVAGALAFLWLIIGQINQHRELMEQKSQLAHQLEAHTKTAQALAEQLALSSNRYYVDALAGIVRRIASVMATDQPRLSKIVTEESSQMLRSMVDDKTFLEDLATSYEINEIVHELCRRYANAFEAYEGALAVFSKNKFLHEIFMERSEVAQINAVIKQCMTRSSAREPNRDEGLSEFD